MKKTAYINPFFYNTVLTNNSISNIVIKEKPKLHCRNTILLPVCIGSIFLVHNGKDYLIVLISESIIGHKLGEFSASRRRYFFKKGKIKKQNKK